MRRPDSILVRFWRWFVSVEIAAVGTVALSSGASFCDEFIFSVYPLFPFFKFLCKKLIYNDASNCFFSSIASRVFFIFTGSGFWIAFTGVLFAICMLLALTHVIAPDCSWSLFLALESSLSIIFDIVRESILNR